jgi:hypothetical protein
VAYNRRSCAVSEWPFLVHRDRREAVRKYPYQECIVLRRLLILVLIAVDLSELSRGFGNPVSGSVALIVARRTRAQPVAGFYRHQRLDQNEHFV